MRTRRTPSGLDSLLCPATRRPRTPQLPRNRQRCGSRSTGTQKHGLCMPTSAHSASLVCRNERNAAEECRRKLGHASRSKVFRGSMTLWRRLKDGLPSKLARRMGVGNGCLHLDAGIWHTDLLSLWDSGVLALRAADILGIPDWDVFELDKSRPHITHSVAPPTTPTTHKRKANARAPVSSTTSFVNKQK